jgi:L-threonylcarbamoyladenylate synthase
VSTECWNIDPIHPAPALIKAAAGILLGGGVVILPTETVYGIAASLDHAHKLFDAKSRDSRKPLPLMVTGAARARAAGALWSSRADTLAERFWPGPLTMVIPMANGGTEGFRAPDHAVTQAVLRACGGALRVTSANLSGGPDPKTAQEALAQLDGRAALALDSGPAEGGIPSTVIRLDDQRLEVLREGGIPMSELEAALKG